MTTQLTYLNPVHNRSCPDPFVLKYCGEYWAYCSHIGPDGRYFGILHSRDLVHWREIGGAIEPFPEEWDCYWAPEVTYHNGRFLMYYSVGNETYMQVRVAVADHPAGPFVDSGRRLTEEEFAIDAHVYIDDDGGWHCFYATDFLEHTHIGTGTVHDRMLDPWTLAGHPRPVTRARYDWQVYDPQRAEKGGVRWHTVEGPFVLKRKGRYYQMFSGGNWQNISYGVSYAYSDTLSAAEEWTQVADGKRILPILRTLPGEVIGPGHNSVVRGPDNVQQFCIYHRWTQELSARVLAIDPLDWIGDRLTVLGPSTTPQPVLTPAFVDWFDLPHSGSLGDPWQCTGDWSSGDGAATQRATTAVAEARLKVPASSFVCEVSLRALDSIPGAGRMGLRLGSTEDPALDVALVPDAKKLLIGYHGNAGWTDHEASLPPDFDPVAFHLLRLMVDGTRIRIELDTNALRWQGHLDLPVTHLALVTQGMSAAFAGFALTIGWEDLFTDQLSAVELGWQPQDGSEDWHVDDQQLWYTGKGDHATVVKGPFLTNYELVVNARLESQAAPNGCYGLYPARTATDAGPLLAVVNQDAHWVLECVHRDLRQVVPLPAEFDPSIHQQFRLRKQGGHLQISLEGTPLAVIDVPSEATNVGLYGHQAVVAWDMVRVTAS